MPPQPAAPLGWYGRLAFVVWCAVLIAGFAAAGSVSPNPRGMGTHQQFGLPPCTFEMITRRPCPMCGMTTCFAHFVRGHWGRAFLANPAGLLLAIACLLQVPWSLACAASGRWLGVRNPIWAATAWLGCFGTASVLQWILVLSGLSWK